MRILHTSDWHLGKVLHERSLLEDQRVALESLLALLAREPHDALIVAGDVFDRSIPPEDAVSLLGAFLQQLREVAPRLPVVMIAGNHDSGARLAWASALLARHHLHLVGDVGALDTPVVVKAASGEEAHLWAVPFLWPGALATAERPTPTQTAAMEAALERIRAKQAPGVTHVLAAHAFAQGGTTSDSERTLVGQANLVPTSLFSGFDYVALGHLHRPQAVGTHGRYSGSLLAYSFSEVGDVKGVCSVEVAAGKVPTATLHPLAIQRRVSRLTGSFDELLTSAAFAPQQEDYLSITLTEAVRTGQPMAMLRRRFPHLLQLVNPVLKELTTGGVRPAPGHKVGDDLEADFRVFHAALNEQEPKPAVLEAFTALRSATKGGAA